MRQLRRFAITLIMVSLLTSLLSACGERRESGVRDTGGERDSDHNAQDRGNDKHDD
ncbi:MAG: hypothetical protein K2X77_17490 [Candidatus Obscuribacterales bacterium]|nr:hypothetical protein [Candidatus Obscuribacterales bacterium]